ncbi:MULTISPECIES: hypothetical protein [unclassified Chromobacterium]|uniref:hypothetical protein n=1 Tax=unclassified Chromobacterium TaxID=2641838 RepID=UPI000652BB2F|nr:hypothetical protein [Chromobacterium sp. LK1]KMN32381.1 hypothetical protein VI26_16800 [Chromobacterium sp. LK1]
MSQSLSSRYSALPPLTVLPFVRRLPQRARIHCWQVPPIQDYGEACEMGREYAAHLLRLLHGCPQHAGNGLLGLIASDIDYADASAAKGFWVGFFDCLEQAMLLASDLVDGFVLAAMLNARRPAAKPPRRRGSRRRSAPSDS